MRRPGGDLLRNPDFLKLWTGQTVSQLGSQVSQLALPLVAVLVLHVSAFYVALLGTVDLLPFLLFALPAGVWIDRIARRPVLIAADAGRAVALASIPLVAAFGSLTIWQLYAVGFVTGTLTVFFDVSYQSYLPSLVGRQHLVEGNAKLELSRSAAQIAGPGLGGALVGAISAPYAIAVDSASFVFSAVSVGLIRRREPRPEPGPAPSMRRELIEGLRFVLGDPRWRALTEYVATFNFFTSIAFALYVVYAVRELGLTPGELGLVLALGNVGWLLGALVVQRVRRRLGVGPTLVLSGFLGGAALLLVPLAPQGFPIPFLVASGMIAGLAIVLYNVTGISLIQALTPDRMLGRANASRRWIVWGTIPLGSLVGGALSTAIGVRPTLFVGTIGASFCFLFLLARPLRSIRELPEEEPPPLLDDAALGLESQVAEL
ncbi:MAG TPA: MFS transporter [Gaiellaceae bacterium]|nr:MFS transporter [Gaiellaceae bacterium]